MFATMVTRRDNKLEGMMYVTDDLQEAQQIGHMLMREHTAIFMRSWVKGVSMCADCANQWWADTGYHDGVDGQPCPLVPKTFARTYWRNFQQAEYDKCAEGQSVQDD
jgi:hypothetical protein